MLKFNIWKQPYHIFCIKLTCKYLQTFLEGACKCYLLTIDSPPFNADVMVMAYQIIFQNCLQDHLYRTLTVTFKAFKLKYIARSSWSNKSCSYPTGQIAWQMFFTAVTSLTIHYYKTFNWEMEEKYQQNATREPR